MRTSAFHRHFQPKRGYWAILVGDYDTIAALNQRGSLIALMALSGICAHALQVRSDEEKRTAALLKSARLELESTKRHMQPHFLMNTLTALSEWIEEDPRTAIEMIEALADEVRGLRRMSAERLVTVGQELRLCRSHLTTMSLRKEVSYALHTEGIEAHRLVPPTVFHTLVENAVTHGPSSHGDVLLRLAATQKGDHLQYTFESPIEPGLDTSFQAGDGTRYIEARLSEVWGDAWSMRQAPVGSTWQVQIEVPA
ncbi:MAG TPA: histidine kinase [Thermoanaerobaculia bacterium]|nr:histidine kinase [Thermoanaerobaculia bacterium]